MKPCRVEPQAQRVRMPKRHPSSHRHRWRVRQSNRCTVSQEGLVRSHRRQKFAARGHRPAFASCIGLEQKPNERMAHFLIEQASIGPTDHNPLWTVVKLYERARISAYFGEPILDWFIRHADDRVEPKREGVEFDERGINPRKERGLRALRRAKAFLWPAGARAAVLDEMPWDVERRPRSQAFHKRDLSEFGITITANMAAFQNYADTCQHR